MAALRSTDTYTIDVDIGGTFTDGVLSGAAGVRWTKVDTTPHDLTECFLRCVEELAAIAALDTPSLLARTSVIRLSSTVATNMLLQRNGPKLGIMVTEGKEAALTEGAAAELFAGIVDPGMVAGLPESISPSGEVRRALDEADVRRAMERLLDDGARGIVVSFDGATANPAHELLARRVVHAEYPRHYLGAVHTWLGAELSSGDDPLRRNTAVLNGYLHRGVATSLYKSDEALRQRGFKRPLLVAHSRSGTARVAKTTALNTYNSGPVAGLVGCARLAKDLYGIEDLVSVDVGGTSVDIGVVAGGEVPFSTEPTVHGIAVGTPMIDVEPVSGGGGGIVKADGASGEVSVGPESAGALPGPACYGLGGNDPTLTDADVILGYINPDFFLGGKRALDAERARNVYQRRVARRLNIPLEEAADRAARQAERDVAERLAAALDARGLDPAGVTMFAFGGGGGLRCCGYAEAVGIRKIIVFPFAGVASAMGASFMDVAHFYDAPVNADLDGPDAVTRYNQTIAGLQARAARDMLGEGFTENEIAFEAEAVIEAGAERRTVHGSRRSPIAGRTPRRRGIVGSQTALGDASRGVRDASRRHRAPQARRAQSQGGAEGRARVLSERRIHPVEGLRRRAAEAGERRRGSRDHRGGRHHRRRAPRLDLHHRRLRQWRAGAGVVKVRITEYLDIDLERELWICNRCDRELGPARENYKEFMLVYQRDPKTVHHPHLDPKEHRYTMSSDKEWVGILEFYCPGCAAMVEVEYLPPGHPVTRDIELDIDALKRKHLGGEGGAAA